nr:unnamed protein product [Callosobruchus chinensis]
MKDDQATSKSSETEQTLHIVNRVPVESLLEVTEIGNVSSQASASTKVLVKSNFLLGSFLESPSAPSREGKRNIERFPFAITSERYQEMYKKKTRILIPYYMKIYKIFGQIVIDCSNYKL